MKLRVIERRDVTVDELNENKFYGFTSANGQNVYAIRRIRKSTPQWAIVRLTGTPGCYIMRDQEGNKVCSGIGSSLKEVIRGLLWEGVEILQYDTAEEQLQEALAFARKYGK